MLSIDHRTKRYGTVVAVDGLSFQVGPGRVTGFLRPNSAGNTTTMRTLLGLVARTSLARQMHDTAELPPVRFLSVASSPPPGSSPTANPERTSR